MATILWQSRSPVVYESFNRKELINASNGGNAYDYQAALILTRHFDVSIDKTTIRKTKEGLLAYWWRMRQYQPIADVFIMEPFPVIFGVRPLKSKSVAMIHHIEDQEQGKSLRHSWFFYKLKKRLTAMDLVITVSGYWENYLKNIGCKNVKVIYNAFNPSDYSVSPETISSFRKRYGFNDRQPIVYIGNASRQKGVYETYEALKNCDYQLIMTGAENKAPGLPVKFLNLDRSDYKTLLNAADVVITMSKLTEGWNRIAHEALLCKTPVIGSGTGGMKELLEHAGQQIIQDAADLPAAVEYVLKNKTSLGNSGYSYVSRFDQSYFENEWVHTIHQLLKK